MRTQLVTLSVAANASGQKFNFPDQPQINRDGMVIDWLESFNADDISHDPNGIAVITAAMMKYSFITLYVGQAADTSQGQGEQYNQVPLTSLHRTQSGAQPFFVRDVFGLPGTRLDWSKTYINTGQALGNVTAISFLLQVSYHQVGLDVQGNAVRYSKDLRKVPMRR